MMPIEKKRKHYQNIVVGLFNLGIWTQESTEKDPPLATDLFMLTA